MIAFTKDCILEIVQKEISKQKLWKTYTLAVICFLACSCTCKVKLEYYKQLVTSFLFKYNIGSKYFADVGIRGSLVSKATK